MVKLVKIFKGKETTIATGDRRRMNDKLKQLRSSVSKGKTSRNLRVEYKIKEEQ